MDWWTQNKDASTSILAVLGALSTLAGVIWAVFKWGILRWCKHRVRIDVNVFEAIANPAVLLPKLYATENDDSPLADHNITYQPRDPNPDLQTIDKDRNYAKAYSNLGILLRVIGKAKEELAVLEKLMEIDPDDFNPYLGIASMNKMLRKEIETRLIEKARQHIPENDFYNRACLESVCDNFNPARAWEDPDFKWIRNHPRFEEIVGPKPEK